MASTTHHGTLQHTMERTNTQIPTASQTCHDCSNIPWHAQHTMVFQHIMACTNSLRYTNTPLCTNMLWHMKTPWPDSTQSHTGTLTHVLTHHGTHQHAMTWTYTNTPLHNVHSGKIQHTSAWNKHTSAWNKHTIAWMNNQDQQNCRGHFLLTMVLGIVLQ